MSLSTKALGRLGRAALIATLMSGAATAALAAPGDREKLAAMQQQLDQLKAQMAQMQAGGQADARMGVMQQQLDAFASQLAEIKASQATADADIATLKKPAVAVSLPNGKPAIATSDGRFSANIRAIIMLDAGKYFQKGNLPAAVTNRDLNEGVNFRRARIGFDGKLFKDFDYSIVYDFGGSGVEDPGRLYEASVTYTRLKDFRLKLGAFEPNAGLAAAVSTSQMPLMERPAPAEVARNVAAGDSRVAIQALKFGSLGEGDTSLGVRYLVSTAYTSNTITSFNGAQPFDEQTGWVGRAVVAPFNASGMQAHLGVNASYVFHPNDLGAAANPRYPAQLRDRPELRLDGARLVDTGAIDSRHTSVLGAEAAAQFNNAMIEGEYFKYRIDRRNSALADPKFDGFYVQASWVLTGEPRVYNASEARFDAPKANFNFNPAAGTWGAFELAARYSVLDLNFREGTPGAATPAGGVRGGEQKILTLGGTWYLNPAMRVMLNWQRTRIDRLNAAGAQSGQRYNALAMRGQMNF